MRVRDESEDEPKDVAHSGDGDAAAWCAMATDRCVAQLSRHAVFDVRASSRLVRQLIPTLSGFPQLLLIVIGIVLTVALRMPFRISRWWSLRSQFENVLRLP